MAGGPSAIFAYLKAHRFTPFPAAWIMMFIAIFFLFFNTGPANTALANVTPPQVRATAFALNILIIHFFGDAFSPPLLGFIAGHSNMNMAFLVIGGAMLISGIIWLLGMKSLAAETPAAEIQAGL